MPIFAVYLLFKFLPYAEDLQTSKEDVPASSLFFMSSPYGACQPEGSMFMVFLFLRFDKLVNKGCISHFRIDTSYDWLKQ